MPVSLEENVSWLEENNNNNKFSNENEWSVTRAHSLFSIMYLWTSVSGQNLNGVTNQMTPFQQYFHRVLFILNVVLTFESVDEILWCYHSNEISSAVLSQDVIYFVLSSNFWICGCNPVGWPFKWNVFSKCLWKEICNLSIPSDLCEAVLANEYTALLSQAGEISP